MFLSLSSFVSGNACSIKCSIDKYIEQKKHNFLTILNVQ